MPDVRLLTPSVAVTIDMDAIVRTLDAVAREEPFPHRVFSLATAGVFAKLYELIVDGYMADPELREEPPTIPPTEPLIAKIVEAKPVPAGTPLPSIKIDVLPAAEIVTDAGDGTDPV
jgi:hypothetical protein